MLCEDKLPESTGDKLTAWGYGLPPSWETGLDFSGEVLIYWGSDSTECLIDHRGTIFRPRLPGMLVKNICCWGSIEIYGRILNFLEI